MKVKSLLVLLCAGVTLASSASIPLTFKHANNSKDGSYFDYPIVEGTNETTYGEPLFNEDGSIDLTSTPAAAGGLWWRTWTLTEACGPEYNVFAFDYKSNRVINDIVLFPQEGNNNHAEIMSGNVYTVSDDWQTLYMPLARSAAWGDWGNPEGEQYKKGKNYLWVSSNDAKAKEAGWKVSVKNIRMMTMEEAAAECVSADVPEVKDGLGTDAAGLITKDFDYEMDGGSDVFVMAAGNALMTTNVNIRPLPAGCTTFTFDYKLVGKNFQPAFYLVYNGGTAIEQVDPCPLLEAVGEDEDPYEAEWKTFTIDAKAAIAKVGYAQKFASKDFCWIQFMNFPEENSLYTRNARWINPEAQSGVSEIGVAERPADNRVFNLMGVEVKGELAPGLYIRNGKKFIVK
jgi:hypothetical protein